MKYLLDTNVFRELGKERGHKNVKAWLAAVEVVDIAIAVLTVREIVKGIAKLAKTKPAAATAIAARATRILNAFDERILPIDRRSAEIWGAALAENEKHADDAGLAAVARVHALILVTRNTKDFAGRGVALLDPFKTPPEHLPAEGGQ